MHGTRARSENNDKTFASFTKEVNPRLDKRPLVFNGRLANRGFTSLGKGAKGITSNPA